MPTAASACHGDEGGAQKADAARQHNSAALAEGLERKNGDENSVDNNLAVRGRSSVHG